MKRLLLSLLLLITLCLTGCSSGPAEIGVVDLKYYDQTGEQGYNQELFYRNDLLATGADPFCLYVTEGEYEGYFFMYNTSDEINGNGYMCWKSKDLNNWEFESICYIPDDSSWSWTGLWAPSVIYDEELDKYLLFYSGTNFNSKYYESKHIGVAVSDSPAGPFIQYTTPEGETNLNGEVIGIGDPLFAFERMPENTGTYNTGEPYKNNKTGLIDAFPFIDPVTKEKYLYMVRTRTDHDTNVIVGVKMKDWFSPDYSTYTQLTQVNVTNVYGTERTEITEGEINEAPNVIYNKGRYYLTCSVNATTDANYTIIQAVADSPLGPFTKIQASQGGVVLGADTSWDHVACCGSHDFVYDGEDLWIIYHQNRDKDALVLERGIAADRMNWVKNEEGLLLLKAVGPTYSVQPLPSSYTGYSNLAPKAKVTATNMLEGSSASYLNDNLVRFQNIDIFEEFKGSGIVTITLDFEDYVTARSLLIYNSYDYYSSFYQVARIDFSFRKVVDGVDCVGTARVEDIYYDFETYAQLQYEIMRPGAPLIIEFDELEINKVTITIACPTGQEDFAISEIMLMGKE